MRYHEDLPITVPAAEYSYSVPQGTNEIRLHNRTNGTLYVSWVTGKVASGKDSISIPAGQAQTITMPIMDSEKNLYYATRESIGWARIFLTS